MANDQTILPGSLAIAAHVKVLDLMVADSLDQLDTTVVLMNLIDSAPIQALPFLAEQFNILRGYKGWKFMSTVQEQRDLLKRAVELNTFSGTPYGIKEALAMIGVVGQVEIVEHFNICYDGSWNYDGSVFYGNHYAYFNVILDLSNAGSISDDDIIGVINEYKRLSSRLFIMAYGESFIESLQSTDSLTLTVLP